MGWLVLLAGGGRYIKLQGKQGAEDVIGKAVK